MALFLYSATWSDPSLPLLFLVPAKMMLDHRRLDCGAAPILHGPSLPAVTRRLRRRNGSRLRRSRLTVFSCHRRRSPRFGTIIILEEDILLPSWAVNCTKSSNKGLTSGKDLKPSTLESTLCVAFEEKHWIHFRCCASTNAFTALEVYRARGTEASPYFTVTHFTELVPTKGLVLVRGVIVFTSKLSNDEAETLSKTAYSFYINDEIFRKVRRFNKDSRDFDFKEVLEELNIPLQG